MKLVSGFLVMLASSALAAPLNIADLESTRTLAAERKAFAETHRNRTVLAAISKPLRRANEREWAGAFWGGSLILERGPEMRAALAQGLAKWDDLSGDDFRRELVQATYTLFPNEFVPEMTTVLGKTQNAKIHAMAAYYLLRAKDNSDVRGEIAAAQAKLPIWAQEGPIIAALRHRMKIDAAAEVAKRPPLRSLLTHEFKSLPVVFSFQRVDRRYPGLAVVRGQDGRFVRNADGSIFHVEQLGMSITDLPGTITNGNTAQGIYSIQGTDVSANVFIGPTPFLSSYLPVESPLAAFIFEPKLPESRRWSAEEYVALLPEDWRSYWPITEAWYAGAAGRGEKLAHGTTIDPEAYRGQPYYPNTPSLGCLTAREEWSPETGRPTRSDQAALVNAFLGAGVGSNVGNGFLVVVELDSKSARVELQDVQAELLAAE